jgi:hypothetical protein
MRIIMKKGIEKIPAIGKPMNYRAKLANASCRTARSGHRWFRRKSSSPCCGIFPENLALPEALALTPS